MLQEEQRENKQSRQTFPSVLIGGRVNIYTCCVCVSYDEFVE